MIYPVDKMKLIHSQRNIVVLICYYGKFPWYFPYFVHSCRYNPSVDFIIVSDNEYERELPENVTIISLPWEEIKRMIKQKLDLNVQIESPYKLCDFKPAYGFIFFDLIQSYDFWGHGDIDVIYGDIRNFITDELLSTYELINVRSDYLAGYFLLFKNSEKMNTLFMESRDYKKVLSSDIHYCFDETNFQYEEFTDVMSLPKRGKEVESMMHLIKRLEGENYVKTYFDHHVIDGVPGKLKWEKGKLYYKNKFEVLLYHLIMFKKVYKPQQRIETIPDTFHISPTRIYT